MHWPSDTVLLSWAVILILSGIGQERLYVRREFEEYCGDVEEA